MSPLCLALLFALAAALPVNRASAGPEAHILRIDPQTSVVDGKPTLTAVIDLAQIAGSTAVTRACSGKTGDAALDCMSDALEAPGAWGKAAPFVPEDVVFSVKLEGGGHLAQLLSHTRFGEAQTEPRIGTAFLLIIDADGRVGKTLDELQAVAEQFVHSMGTQDWVDVVVLGTSSIVTDSGWLKRAQQADAVSQIRAQSTPISSRDRTRPLLDLIKKSALNSFRSLNSSGNGELPPLHQAMVVLSSGYGGGDPSTTGPGGAELARYFSVGRFDSENDALPKLPVPIISVYAPPNAQAEHAQLARSFMENLSNPAIGGFFSLIRDGQSAHATRIVDAVRSRFAQMIVARFALSCVAPTATQSFSLLFKNASKNILGDSSFSNVPLGLDPGQWPLDIDAELTRQNATKGGGVHPGGVVRVLGNFCWETDLSRPEIYFIPPGEGLPRDLTDPQAAQDVQKRLVAMDMRGKVLEANSSFAEFKVPESQQILHGDGERRTVRIVVVDSKLRRTSGLTKTTVLTLKAQDVPLPMLPILFAVSAGVVSLGGVTWLLRRGARRASVAATRGPRSSEDSPYARPAPVSRSPRNLSATLRAVLEGDSGRFIVLPGADLRAGRDGTRAAAVVAHPQVSGLHATFRLQDNVLSVRDEGSTSGTRINGRLIPSGQWETAVHGAEIALGPQTFRVTLETTPRSKS